MDTAITRSPGLQIWTADPRTFKEESSSGLTALLDQAEQARAAKFRSEPDRRCYRLVHALRRAALARTLDLAPGSIAFDYQFNGRPLLTTPVDRPIHFSHARTRDGVAFVVTSAGSVGVDVETMRRDTVDFSLLEPFVTLPDARHRVAELGSDEVFQFYFYWTALEAFWKSAGRGLSSDNPRIRCGRDDNGALQVTVEGDPTARARLITVRTPLQALVSVAIRQGNEVSAKAEPILHMKVRHCNSSMEVSDMARRTRPG